MPNKFSIFLVFYIGIIIFTATISNNISIISLNHAFAVNSTSELAPPQKQTEASISSSSSIANTNQQTNNLNPSTTSGMNTGERTKLCNILPGDSFDPITKTCFCVNTSGKPDSPNIEPKYIICRGHVVDANPIKTTPDCLADNTYLNPLTNTCVAKCPSGYKPNQTTHICVINSVVGKESSGSNKVTTMLNNPIQVCSTGYHLEDNKCIKGNPIGVKSSMSPNCPGSYYDKNTKKCVPICDDLSSNPSSSAYRPECDQSLGTG
jgi:hypothetical protein